MITLLTNIVEIFLNIPDYIMFAIESIWNLFMTAVSALFAVATSLIPLPEEPGPPEFIANINWFFPIGPLISIATPVVSAYVAFLAIRWIYQKVGDL